MSYRRPPDVFDAPAPSARAMSVVVPPEHQGVVNALRAAYPAERRALPNDLAALLARLD